MAVLFRESAYGDDEAEKASSSPRTSKATASFFIAAVHDTPTAEVPLGRGTAKKPPKTRRRLDATSVSALIADLKRKAEAEGRTLEACVEQPSPSPLNGKLAWYGSGLAFGVWSGVLAAHGVRTSFVRPQEWKRAFGLEGGGKDAARAVAVEALDNEKRSDEDGDDQEEENPESSSSSSSSPNPTAAGLLTRKKDHGRADAMLIALWRARGGVDWGGLEADVAAAAAAAAEAALALASAEGASGEEEEEEEGATTADETDGTELDDDEEEESSSESSESSCSDDERTAASKAKSSRSSSGVKATAAATTRRAKGTSE